MKKIKGKIILVDDEAYEQDFLGRALNEKNWDIKIEYFNNVDDALEYLEINSDDIFLVISDMDMPKKSGLDFKKTLDSNAYLRQKTIPFIFVTNSLSNERVTEAYQYHIQGYFQKPMTSKEQTQMLEIIIKYWVTCIHPVKENLSINAYTRKNLMNEK
jgi:DNA-binding NtrC family response regulator